MTTPERWTPLRRIEPDGYVASAAAAAHAAKLSKPLDVPDEVWVNDLYQVLVYRQQLVSRWQLLPDGGPESHFPRMVYLSIRREDRRPVRNWRHLQRIKNEIVGARHEAVELFPSTDRVMDTSNQYHLFVLADPELRFPFGSPCARTVTGRKHAETIGAGQEPFAKGEADAL